MAAAPTIPLVTAERTEVVPTDAASSPPAGAPAALDDRRGPRALIGSIVGVALVLVIGVVLLSIAGGPQGGAPMTDCADGRALRWRRLRAARDTSPNKDARRRPGGA